MKRLFFILSALLFTACGTPITDKPLIHNSSPVPVSLTRETASFQSAEYQALTYDEVKAIWISYLELAEICTDGEESFREKFADMLDNCVDIGINTVYVHVRTFSDSFYPSEYYPYTKAFNGKPFDALEIMIDEAHKRQLSFHAWINPLRCETGEVLDSMSEKYPVKKWYEDPEKYLQYIMYVEETGHYWLDPGVEAVRELIAKGAGEIVKNYNVDGVHIDDYFYPTTESYFDAGVYVEQGSDLPFDEWRFENCTAMVKQIYEAVKAENSTVEFGIAPQGNIENNYNYMFADVKKWCAEEGFCDYICPQIYFGYNNPYKPFAETVDAWVKLCSESGKKLIIGIGAYKINSEDEFINEIGIVSRQADLSLQKTNGAAMFSYNSFFKTERGEQEAALVKKTLRKK